LNVPNQTTPATTTPGLRVPSRPTLPAAPIIP
jgi:hypothetical protein